MKPKFDKEIAGRTVTLGAIIGGLVVETPWLRKYNLSPALMAAIGAFAAQQIDAMIYRVKAKRALKE